ncbi:MAG: hypothetical protein HQ567_20910, partial [Candidatus Nealsonbacteria bacterium]|nr:hypothetical protein [Candidatus Nealsonbacteria bacterium]
HQPQIFHPGGWLKNFALAELARRHKAVAVNLTIDSDTVKNPAVKVPTGSVAEPVVETIAYDRAQPTLPYEQRRIVDRGTFSGFGRRVAQRIASLVPDPLIRQYWPLVTGQAEQSDNLGACLARARHKLEGQWGLQTLEVPQSRVCDSEPFCWFVACLLARASEFRAVYNEAVGEYRRAHRIRSTAHPVPDLTADGPWLETPFWIFSNDDPLRRQLLVRRNGGRTMLCDRHTLEIDLPLSADGDPGRTVERLLELRRGGLKIRSRALITTLWARLVLGDLFVHGIGGAKYDHVADALIERFFGLHPPGFAVVSGTLHLPIPRQRVTVDQSRAIRCELRRLLYAPERYIDVAHGEIEGVLGNPDELISAKQRWIQTPQVPENARTRCRTIRQLNEAMQPWVQSRRQQLQQQAAKTERALHAEAILASREHGFCLVPEKTFREFAARLLPKDV